MGIKFDLNCIGFGTYVILTIVFILFYLKLSKGLSDDCGGQWFAVFTRNIPIASLFLLYALPKFGGNLVTCT